MRRSWIGCSQIDCDMAAQDAGHVLHGQDKIEQMRMWRKDSGPAMIRQGWNKNNTDNNRVQGKTGRDGRRDSMSQYKIKI